MYCETNYSVRYGCARFEFYIGKIFLSLVISDSLRITLENGYVSASVS